MSPRAGSAPSAGALQKKLIGEVGAAMGMNGQIKMEDDYTDGYLPPAADHKIDQAMIIADAPPVSSNGG
jgi:hypothetical protein